MIGFEMWRCGDVEMWRCGDVRVFDVCRALWKSMPVEDVVYFDF